MRLFINELSFAESHVTARAAAGQIESFLRARAGSPPLRRGVYCTKLLPDLPLGDGQTLRTAVASLPPPARTLFYTWAGRLGPFLEDERADMDKNLFFFEGEDVTERGLGEAARRLIRTESAGTYSFIAEPGARFRRALLTMTHGVLLDSVRDITKLTDQTRGRAAGEA